MSLLCSHHRLQIHLSNGLFCAYALVALILKYENEWKTLHLSSWLHQQCIRPHYLNLTSSSIDTRRPKARFVSIIGWLVKSQRQGRSLFDRETIFHFELLSRLQKSTITNVKPLDLTPKLLSYLSKGGRCPNLVLFSFPMHWQARHSFIFYYDLCIGSGLRKNK